MRDNVNKKPGVLVVNFVASLDGIFVVSKSIKDG